MANEARATDATDPALHPIAPGALIRIGTGPLWVDIAPQAGGRLAQISFDGCEWLVGYGAANAAMLAWGSYPMLPWAGRLRRGRFNFAGTAYQLPANLDGNAIHGLGFAMPWSIQTQSDRHVELFLQLPEDTRWPFGGSARQRIEIRGERTLHLELSVTANKRAMPAVIGWHPWFRKPDRLEFSPRGAYPRDADGIAVSPIAEPPAGPWDDCFVNVEPVLIERAAQRVRLTSDCSHWVVYDEPRHATCIEPQTGPPDAFNLESMQVLAPGASLAAWFALEWL